MKTAKALALPVALLILAEIGARLGGPSDSIAPPSAAALALVEALGDGSLLEATRDTLLSAFGGLTIGAGLGLVLGILLGSLRTLDRLMELTIGKRLAIGNGILTVEDEEQAWARARISERRTSFSVRLAASPAWRAGRSTLKAGSE